jgi:demethylmenaquinone methyltransferase/2-methoxy-6-polyprenyl-1,4-benzoquinol methylase
VAKRFWYKNDGNGQSVKEKLLMATGKKFTLKIKDYIHTPELKREYNERHFGEAAKRYNFATRAMSLGRDLAWKRRLVAALPELQKPVCVDLACGTGDVTALLAARYPRGQVIGIDLTEEMLELARRRSTPANLSYRRGDMMQTRLETSSVDIVTGSYALRNAPELGTALTEIRRILKPGGTVALLDFSKPPNRWFQAWQYQLLKNWCGLWGLLLHGNSEVHAYIATSLTLYPDREQLRLQLEEAGFSLQQSAKFYLGTLELLLLQKGNI